MSMRLRDLVKCAKAAGATVEEPTRGSHWKVTVASKSYTIPCHNGIKTEVSDIYINGLCRCF